MRRWYPLGTPARIELYIMARNKRGHIRPWILAHRWDEMSLTHRKALTFSLLNIACVTIFWGHGRYWPHGPQCTV